MTDRRPILESLAHAATVIAVVFGIFAFCAGAEANQQAARTQAQAAAVNVLQNYFELAIANPTLANRSDELPVDDKYDWFASHAYFTAETIFTLTDEPEWQNTVRSIIRLHHAYVRDGRFTCSDFNPRFVAFVQSELRNFRCASDDDAPQANPDSTS